jgi:hypothetical protein
VLATVQLELATYLLVVAPLHRPGEAQLIPDGLHQLVAAIEMPINTRKPLASGEHDPNDRTAT